MSGKHRITKWWNVYRLSTAYFISCTASILSISALATERYLTVTSNYRRTYSRSKTITGSVLIWIFSIAVSNVYFATGFYTFVFAFANTTIIATLVIITYTYIRIYQSLHAHVERGTFSQDDRFAQQRLNYERKATRSFLLVLSVFVICNVTSCVIIYIILLCYTCSCHVIHWLRDFQFLMALINCAANQFLYAWRMPPFVRAFKNLFSRTVGCVRSRRVETYTGSVRLSSLTAPDNTSTTNQSFRTESLSGAQSLWYRQDFPFVFDKRTRDIRRVDIFELRDSGVRELVKQKRNLLQEPGNSEWL